MEMEEGEGTNDWRIGLLHMYPQQAFFSNISIR
jgi:hypothetical protein